MKKADMSMGVIISLIIVMVIIAVLLAVFYPKVQLLVKNAKSCEAKNGYCTSSCDFITTAALDCKDGEVCCIT